MKSKIFYMNLLKEIPAEKRIIIRAILASALDVTKVYRMLKRWGIKDTNQQHKTQAQS